MERGPEKHQEQPPTRGYSSHRINLSVNKIFRLLMERNDAQQRWNFYSLLKPMKGSARFKVIRNMKTKTAIISIDNLKVEDLPVLKQALQSVPGVDHVDFSLERSVAVVDFDPSLSHIDDFLRAVLKAGFKVL